MADKAALDNELVEIEAPVKAEATREALEAALATCEGELTKWSARKQAIEGGLEPPKASKPNGELAEPKAEAPAKVTATKPVAEPDLVAIGAEPKVEAKASWPRGAPGRPDHD